MANVPCVVIGPRASDSRLAERGVAIDTGVAGIHEGGTALRMDDVPLPLRAPLESPNTAAGVARALRDGVVKNRRAVTR
jgi:formylmethanofuran dehydrogenase subunit B